MNKYNADRELVITDLIGILLSKIIPIIVCAVLMGTIGLGYAVGKAKNSKVQIPTEEAIINAREMLSSIDASMVDNIFTQYISYMEYKDDWQSYYANQLYANDEITNYLKQQTVFTMSSNVFGASRFVSSLSLTPEVWNEIRTILPDGEAVSSVYNRVWIDVSERESLTLLNDDNDGTYLPNEYILTINVIAKSYEQCERIETIVENSIYEQLEELKKIDDNARLSLIGRNYSNDLSAWIMNRQNEIVTNLTNLENVIKNFNNNQLKNLSDEQKIYYDLLVSKYNDQSTVEATPSKKKYLIIGVFGGFVLACGFIVLKYLFTASIKTKKDISLAYNIPVLNTITIDGKKHPLFDKLIRKLRDIDGRSMGASIEMAASDIGILMDKSGTDSLYLIETSGTDDESGIAAKLVDKIKSENDNYNVCVGKPLDSAEELKKMASADNVVLLAEIQKTKMDLTDKYYELFQRYGSNVLGSIVAVRP